MSAEHVLEAPRALRRRHRRSSLFAVLAAGSLGLGVLVVALLMVSTLRESGRLSSMHATATAGLALSQRAVTGEHPAPYVTVAQVEAGSAAATLGLLQGDALLAVTGHAVSQVQHVWNAVAAMPADLAAGSIAWAPNSDALLGELEAVPIAGRPGTFRTRLGDVGTDTVAAKAGLRDGDVLVSAGGTALFGTQQAWQTIVVVARDTAGAVPIVYERAGVRQTLELPVRRTGDLPLARDLLAAIWRFCTGTDEPRYPEHASLKIAILGSLWVVAVTILFSFPLGVAAAVYLEEYAKRSRLTSVLQVLIANLAGVPSVVYGIIGWEIISRALDLQQSILAGGITLGLLILPVMILGCREALRTVPPWVRHAAFAVGATPSQVVWYQVLPYALPGMLTSMILAISRAIGEAAPLIMLGAFVFLTHPPTSVMSPFTVVPIQIFTWATQPQAGYETVTAVAIVVLLVILLLLNGTAIVLRNRLQLRW